MPYDSSGRFWARSKAHRGRLYDYKQAYKSRREANAHARRLKRKGYGTFVSREGGQFIVWWHP